MTMTAWNRRQFLSRGAAALAGLASFRPGFAFAARPPGGLGSELPRPTPAQLAWQRAELGVVFHWDLHVFDGERYSQAANRKAEPLDPQLFAPDRYDIDQWFRSVKGMGARFALLTACHETGFRLWQSDANPYCMKLLKWGDGEADIVRDFVEAARRHGVAPGIYHGARWNAQLAVYDHRVTERSPLSQDEYRSLIEAECEELATRYGELFEIWFDGGILAPDEGGPDVLPIFEEHQPGILYYHSDERRDARWGGSESGTVPYPCWATVDPKRARTGPPDYEMLRHGDPEGEAWCPAMSDAPLRGWNGRHEWFWEPEDEAHVYPLPQLIEMYENSVGRNSTLIMGLTPDPHGRVPELDTGRCIEWGEAIRQRYGTPLASTSGERRRMDLALPGPVVVDRIQLRERIEDGHRVRRYGLDGQRRDGVWEKLGVGSCIGNRRIHPIRPQELQRIRLNLWTAGAEAARIEEFSAFSTR